MSELRYTRNPKKTTIADWILQLEGVQERFNDWEANFYVSVASQFARTDSLSVRQLEILEDMYVKYTK